MHRAPVRVACATGPAPPRPAIHRDHLPQTATGPSPAKETPLLRELARAPLAQGLRSGADRGAAVAGGPQCTGSARFARGAAARSTLLRPPMPGFPRLLPG